ncbi:hypothetical protein [Streptomyces sp. GMY02]|uniref:hypothetical protein n=1 Tax=Streptomyces sp. GMY02 TaxID=1333528 RepID=UPI001F1DD2B5|nr:hypothetical protein [Streptomyces sp. GMY02]
MPTHPMHPTTRVRPRATRTRPRTGVPARVRVRLLAAAILVLTAAAALTGCDDGEGVRDEGPSTTSSQPLGLP